MSNYITERVKERHLLYSPSNFLWRFSECIIPSKGAWKALAVTFMMSLGKDYRSLILRPVSGCLRVLTPWYCWHLGLQKWVSVCVCVREREREGDILNSAGCRKFGHTWLLLTRRIPSCDNPKRHQTLPKVFLGGRKNCPQLKNHALSVLTTSILSF